MPYIVVSGQLIGSQLGGVERTIVAGLSAQERDRFVAIQPLNAGIILRDYIGKPCFRVNVDTGKTANLIAMELEDVTPGCSKVSGSGTVKIEGRGRVLQILNRLHDKYGYEVISHSMAITSSNQERMSWTLYRKHSPSSQPQSQTPRRYIVS